MAITYQDLACCQEAAALPDADYDSSLCLLDVDGTFEEEVLLDWMLLRFLMVEGVQEFCAYDVSFVQMVDLGIGQMVGRVAEHELQPFLLEWYHFLIIVVIIERLDQLSSNELLHDYSFL